MRVVIQRSSGSSVLIHGHEKRTCGPGMVILLGIEEPDNRDDILWLCSKITNLRIFPDENGVMNRSVLDTHGDILIVSQFTLFASTRKGNRPSYIRAARPESAEPLYRQFIDELQKSLGKPVITGEFGADMQIELINDGPVTILIDSKGRE